MASHEHISESVAADDVAHHVATKLAEVGQRFTAGRRDIVAALSGADRPLSIPEILSITKGLAQSSAYRNLAVLENAGVVIRVITTDEWARYTPGSAATDFKSRFDQLKGAAFLQAYDTLRGGGAITEIEGTKAENAKTRMNLAQSEPEFIAAARDFQAALKDMVKSNKATLAKGSAGDNVDANNPLLK